MLRHISAPLVLVGAVFLAMVTLAGIAAACDLLNPVTLPPTTAFKCACPGGQCDATPNASWLNGTGLIEDECTDLLTALTDISNNPNPTGTTTVLLAPVRFLVATHENYIWVSLGDKLLGTSDERPHATGPITNVHIKGTYNGTARTEISVGRREVGAVFELANNIHGIEISDIDIRNCNVFQDCPDQSPCSSDSPCILSAGVATAASGNSVITNSGDIYVHDLTIEHINTGINVHAGAPARACQVSYPQCPEAYSIQNVLIADNHIIDMDGRDAGYGYGISSGMTKCTRITHNEITRAQRHSIYQSNGDNFPVDSTLENSANAPCRSQRECILIDHNWIIDHLHGGTSANIRQAAIAVARARNTTVAHNIIVHSHAYGISVERAADFYPPLESAQVCYDGDILPSTPYENDTQDCKTYVGSANVNLINNRFIGSSYQDIWINNGLHSTFLWHNTRQVNSIAVGGGYWGPASELVDDGSIVRWDDAGRLWNNTQAIADAGSFLLIMQGNRLHKVFPRYGRNPEQWAYQWDRFIYWNGFQNMVVGKSCLFVMQVDYLHCVQPDGNVDGNGNFYFSYTWSNSPWPAFQAITSSADGYAYIANGGALYKVNPSTLGIVSHTGYVGPNMQGLAPGDQASRFYMQQNGVTHDVDGNSFDGTSYEYVRIE